MEASANSEQAVRSTTQQQKQGEQPKIKDLWTLASQKLTDVQSQSSAKTLVFLGEKKSGKSSLIAKFLDEPVKEDMPETTALDFKYGTKLREDKKTKVNVYELGGGRILANMLGAALNASSIASTTVVLAIDLSKPGNSVDSLLFWLNAIREQSQVALEILQKTDPQAYQQMQQRVQARWGQHEDRNKITFSLVPLVIVCSKFDAFANNFESVKKKQLCLALRYIAHQNGADLVFGSVREKLPSQLYRALLNFHVFEGGPLGRVEKNPNNPVHVPAGADSFASVGEPDGAQMRSRVSFEQLWQEIVEAQFEKLPDQSAQTSKALANMAKYSEDKVDNMRRQKDEELEQYKKDIERAKRFESKQMAVNAYHQPGQASAGQPVQAQNIQMAGAGQGSRPRRVAAQPRH